MSEGDREEEDKRVREGEERCRRNEVGEVGKKEGRGRMRSAKRRKVRLRGETDR